MKIDMDLIEYAFLFVSSDAPFTNQAFLNRKTGDCYFISEYGDFGDGRELPEDIDDNPNYIEVPHKNDLSLGVKLVMSFAAAHMPESFEHISEMFRRKGAYRRYKAYLQSMDCLEAWHLYEEEQSQLALKKWCLENDIDTI